MHPGKFVYLLTSLVLDVSFFLLKKVLQLCSKVSSTAKYIHFYFVHIKSFYDQKGPNSPALTMFIEEMNNFCRRYSDRSILRANLLFKPVAIVYKPDSVEQVLTSPIMMDKAAEYNLLKAWMGEGLIVSSGSKWKHRRKLIAPAFHFKILEDFITVFQESARGVVKRIEELLDRQNIVDLRHYVLDCSLDIICQTAMGAKLNFQEGENGAYHVACRYLATTFMHRLLRPWLQPDCIFNLTPGGRQHCRHLKIVKDFTKKMITEKKAQMLAQKDEVDASPDDSSDSLTKKKKMFLELLLEMHFRDPSFTEEDILEEVDVFVAAGFETTGMTMAWALFLIGQHPHVQAEIHAELDAIFGDDLDRDVGKEDLVRMKYLECVIKETLRLYPSVPFIGRTPTENCKISRSNVPKGTFIVVYPYMLHRDEKNFPDPERFDPERFFPENSVGRHPYSFIPFSAGPRNCIGQKFGMMEQKVVLSNILRKYRVTSLDKREDIRVIPLIVLGNVQPLRFRVDRRIQG